MQKISDEPFDIIMNHFNAAKVYELPDEIAKRSDWLLKAHVDALKYNSRTVRLDDLKKMRQSGNVNIFKCDLLGFADDKSGDGLRVGRCTKNS